LEQASSEPENTEEVMYGGNSKNKNEKVTYRK